MKYYDIKIDIKLTNKFYWWWLTNRWPYRIPRNAKRSAPRVKDLHPHAPPLL